MRRGGGSLIEAPPPRYRVVEKGRRLETLDSWNGDRPVAGLRVARPAARPGPEPRGGTGDAAGSLWPVSQDAHGNTVIATRNWWDAKGPRRVTVDPDADFTTALGAALGIGATILAAILVLSPWMLVAIPFALSSGKLRTQIREGIAAQLDQLGQDAGIASSDG